MQRPPEVYTQSEVTALMDACSRRGSTGPRDRALICVLWRAQLRISEALQLRPVDCDLDRCVIRVLRGKGRKARTVAIDRKAALELKIWIAKRASIDGATDDKPVFCTRRARGIDSSYMRQKLPRLARRAGILKRVHAHGLRHTGASELADEGMSLVDIQHQLGHSSVATTDRYLHAINPRQRIERMRSRTW